MLIRAFIALELSPSLQEALSRLVIQLRGFQLNGVRWTNPTGIHLTLRFLGDSHPDSLAQMRADLEAIARQSASFDLQIQGFGAFPNLKRPRVIWVGVQAPPALHALQQSIETIARRAGFPAEERPFSPHLTLGRVQRSITLAQLSHLSAGISGVTVGVLGNLRVEQFILFRSDLKPSGAVYTRLANFALCG